MTIALYARVSTTDQTCEQQLTVLRDYAARLGGTVTEYIEVASGAKDTRPELARLMDLARRRKVDLVLVTKLDRFGRSLQKLVGDIQDLTAWNVRFIALEQGIDTDKNSAAGQLLLHLLAAFAQFERTLISDRTRAGLARVKASGRKLGRKPLQFDVEHARELIAGGASYRKAAAAMGVPVSVLFRGLRAPVQAKL